MMILLLKTIKYLDIAIFEFWIFV